MSSKGQYFLGFILSIQSLGLFAHGENKAGPNGGHIQMPGAFHTELVIGAKKDTLRVFLLDLSFKNPVVKDSKVEMSYKKDNLIESLKCKPIENYFECNLEKSNEKKSGDLVVNASRLGAAARPAVYTLPLSFDKE